MLKKKEEEFDTVIKRVMEMKSKVDGLTAERDKLDFKCETLDAKVTV